MKNILIANIGNRNILYKNQSIDNKIFRIETERIWQNFESEKEHLAIQIIPLHINLETEGIILISTDQENTDYNHQDTLFEGKILKKLLETNYSLPVEIETFKGNPTDENQIFPFYAALIRKIISNKNEIHFVFNDAGGTPQMKLVVKELLDFYLANNRYKIVYSDQKDEKRVIDRIYKSKYILLKTAQKFVEEFNYTAAIKIIDEIPENSEVTKELRTLIKVGARRINFELGEIEILLKKESHLLKKHKVLFESIFHKNAPGDAIQFSQLNSHSRLNIFEIASICQLYFKIENYTLGVATYYRFCEELFDRFARNYGHYDLSKESVRRKLIEENFDVLNQKFRELYPDRDFSKNYGLPVLALYALVFGDDNIKSVTRLLMKTISLFRQIPYEGIDLLRNKCFLAHKNNAVTIEMINKTEPKFLNQILPEIFKALNMPEENIYFSLNRIITNEIMNN